MQDSRAVVRHEISLSHPGTEETESVHPVSGDTKMYKQNDYGMHAFTISFAC